MVWCCYGSRRRAAKPTLMNVGLPIFFDAEKEALLVELRELSNDAWPGLDVPPPPAVLAALSPLLFGSGVVKRSCWGAVAGCPLWGQTLPAGPPEQPSPTDTAFAQLGIFVHVSQGSGSGCPLAPLPSLGHAPGPTCPGAAALLWQSRRPDPAVELCWCPVNSVDPQIRLAVFLVSLSFLSK